MITASLKAMRYPLTASSMTAGGVLGINESNVIDVGTLANLAFGFNDRKFADRR